MKIFVQSASVEELRRASDAGLIDGVALPVTEFADPETVQQRLEEISTAFALPVVIPVSAFSSAEMYREAREISRSGDRIIVQVPFLEDAITPIRRLVADGIKVCATHVYSGVQAFFAAKVGATMVMVQMDDLDSAGQRSAQVVSEIRDVLDQSDVECDLMVASPRNSTHFTEALLAGADSVCLSPSIMSDLMLNALTDRGVDRFLRDVSRRHKPRGV
jgi:transaldolase